MKELEYPFDSDNILKKKRSLKKELLKKEGLIKKRIAILCGSTVGDLQDIIELFLLNQGILPIFWQGQYDRLYEEALFPPDELKNFSPDLIYIHTSVRNIKDFPELSDRSEDIKHKVDSVINYYGQIWQSLNQQFHCPIIQNNFEELPYRVLGNADAWYNGGGIRYINQLNMAIAGEIEQCDYVFLNDLHYQASWFGLEQWFDQSIWYAYKYPFSLKAIPLVAFNIANIIKSLYGKNKKALVLDLDNTLWGGVIGDVGVDNIKLGIETPKGMAFSEFQSYIKKLSKLGIALNICSKNEKEIAKTGFDHPASILKYDDFIIPKINWDNKDANIELIAKELNILPESIVFLDDNPAERELVEKSIPGISVPKLLAPEKYLQVLDKSGFFEVTTLSNDDKKRNEYYKANIERQQLLVQFKDYTEYLTSLEMTTHMAPFGPSNIERIVQLINKTNQFNLTTKRYSMEDVKEYLKNRNITLCADLQDKFGDNGIVSCLMGKIKDDELHIDLWIMSCRVFKRNLEYAVFDTLIKKCLEFNIKKIYGYYFKTAKNHLVESFYEQLGFSVCEKDDSHGIFEFTVSKEYENKNLVMEVNYE